MSRRALVALGVAALAIGCGGETAVPGPYPQAPVVVVSIDTLRADRLPAYGYQPGQTPALDALRRDAVLFSRVYSNVPLTLPSHSSIFSGQLPGRHGVRDNSGYRLDAAGRPWLPELLRQAGYRTGAAVSSFVLRAETGVAAGFDRYDSDIDVRATETLGNSQRSGGETLRRALQWLREPGNGAPPFLFVHLYEPHTPYAAPEPFASRLADPYDAEVAAADSLVGELVAALRELGLYDGALLVVLSDHGEGLGDHGEAEHGIFLYREALQVPLLVKLPGGVRGGGTIEHPAQLADVAPTVLELLGLPLPAGMDGAPLFSLAAAEEPAARLLYAETFYPRLHFGWSELTSLIRGDDHYIEGPIPELFDLARDAAERHNVLAEERRTYAELRAAMKELAAPLVAPAEEDAETAQALASLGYVGRGAVAAGPLPDPKTEIHTLEELGRATMHFTRQEYAAAAALYQRLVERNPLLLDGWENLGVSLQRLGRREEALAALQRAMEVSSGSGHVAIATANVLLELERYEEARQHARLGLATSPAVAHDLLARIALTADDLETATREVEAALASRGSRVGPLLTMARVRQARGELGPALQLVEQAAGELDQGVDFPGLDLLRADLLARLDRPQEAEAAFRRAMVAFPPDPQPYVRLAMLYAARGMPAQAVATLRELVERVGSPAAYAAAVETLRILGDPQGAAGLLRHALTVHPASKELRALAG